MILSIPLLMMRLEPQYPSYFTALITHVSLTPMQKQDAASNNCGIFAIAAATAIANSCNPSLLHFKEKEMRKHLYDCFENGTITLFPCYDV